MLLLSLGFQLFRLLLRKRGTPFSHLHTKYPLRFKIIWLDVDSNWTLCFIKDDDTREPINASCAKLLGLIFAQIAFILAYCSWYLALALPYLPWLIIGAILLQLKVLSLGSIWNFWFHVYTGGNKYDIKEDIDIILLNKSIQDQFVLGSSEQWIIQIYNTLAVGGLNGNYSAVGVLSPALSILMVLNGSYRLFLYLVIYKGYAFDQLSFELAAGNEKKRKRDDKKASSLDSKLKAPLDSTINEMHISLSANTGEISVVNASEDQNTNIAFLMTQNSMQKSEILILKAELEKQKLLITSLESERETTIA